uniref:Uncharacterized protein n=1 Tax=Arundo donax TaxID=35708 RepID=A0A0A9QA50_ARUDO
MLRGPGQGGGDRPAAGQAVPDVRDAVGLRRAAPVPPPLRLRRLRARLVRHCWRPLRRRRICLPHVPRRGHRHSASVLLVAPLGNQGKNARLPKVLKWPMEMKSERWKIVGCITSFSLLSFVN